MNERVLVTGGAGYVGSILVPLLLNKGYPVTVLDTFWFWDSPEEFLANLNGSIARTAPLMLIKGDIRDGTKVLEALDGVGSVIHLACLSNDPSADLDRTFTHRVNYDGSVNVINLSKKVGVERFVYASSSSVYGVKQEPNVTEHLPTNPLTQYSELKVAVEHYLLQQFDDRFRGVILRPSTVCGFSPRIRFDLVMNILTCSAITRGKIKVIGKDLFRPLIHIMDMARAYELLLSAPITSTNGKVYNVGYGNMTVGEIAQLVAGVVGNVSIDVEETNDLRSYRVCSDKIKEELGFLPTHELREAVEDIKRAFHEGKITNTEISKYYNIRRMKELLSSGVVH